MRAAMEVVSGQAGQRIVSAQSGHSGGLRSKVRHGGAQKATSYTGMMAGGAVPMRLSANEVDEVGSEDADSNYAAGTQYHQRSGSGRSSLGSGKRVSSFGHVQGRYSQSSTPPNGQGSSPADTMTNVEEETPVPSDYAHSSGDYFVRNTPRRNLSGLSTGSGSSGEREQGFGSLGGMPGGSMPYNTKRAQEDEKKKKNEDLMRRGSVDERTMTMSGVRLFVANPDLDD
ncbi:hypothetical protein LTS18_001436 [Coniosporium uncinatum]|uniref:Uncharacterized protein n=1 Tax=Coniosporium uncinatum TaxID=93489 RepID=A0ACC3DEV3_9PEZI|nr:hypothetical protein LTS18_001436 [Coniosporium uncinatum]